MKAIIFDIDGTLADVRSIAHYFQHYLEEDKDYDRYHMESVQVPVVDWVAEAARQAHKDGYKVLILTARKIKYLDHTRAFLTKHNVQYDMLFMREDDDDRPDHEYKRDGLLYTRDFGYEVERAYEDNPKIVALWESEGIETIHVQNRGFDYTTGDIMSKTYFATDGSYGDAKDLIILDTTSWNDDMWEIIRQLSDSDRYRFADEKHFELVNKDMLESGA